MLDILQQITLPLSLRKSSFLDHVDSPAVPVVTGGQFSLYIFLSVSFISSLWFFIFCYTVISTWIVQCINVKCTERLMRVYCLVA